MRTQDPIFNLEDFEGPLDLLLHLIENKELDIYQVAIKEVLSQFQTYLKTLLEHDLDLGAEFLGIVSSLMLLKSKMLIPEESTELAEIDESTLRLDIIEQLVHYYKFKNIALSLGEKEQEQSCYYNRGIDPQNLSHLIQEQLKPVKESILSELFLKVLEKKRALETKLITEEEYRVPDKIKEIKHLLTSQERAPFFEVFSFTKPKGELIALFIALLELLKQGFATLNQNQDQWMIEKSN